MAFKKLAVPFFALTLVLGACGSDPAPTPTGTGGTTGSGGGGGTRTGGTTGSGGSASGGTTGSGGTASGGSTGSGGTGSGDTAADMSGGDTSGDTSSEVKPETGSETGGDTGGDTASANICSTYVANSGTLAGISAADFCAKYATVCTFTGAERYTNMGDCVTKYNAVATAAKNCRAGHLCNAAASAGAVTTHCPHATGSTTPGMTVATCVGP